MLASAATLGLVHSPLPTAHGFDAPAIRVSLPARCVTVGGHRHSLWAGRTALVVSAAQKGDLNWSHVARDVKARLAHATSGKQDRLDQLQAWLSEGDKLVYSGETDEERGQAEIVADKEAEEQGLESLQGHLNVKSWLAGDTPPGGGVGIDDKMAGALVVRLLQAYHKDAGEAFDDENEDHYWRLQGFLPGVLAQALDTETIKRMVKAYLSMPFSGV